MCILVTKGRHKAQWIRPLYVLYVFKIFPYVYTAVLVHIMYNKQTNNFWISFNIGVILVGVGWNVCHFSCRYTWCFLFFCVMYISLDSSLFFSCLSSFNLISCCRRAFRSARLRDDLIFFATIRHLLFVGYAYVCIGSVSSEYILPLAALKDLSIYPVAFRKFL